MVWLAVRINGCHTGHYSDSARAPIMLVGSVVPILTRAIPLFSTKPPIKRSPYYWFPFRLSRLDATSCSTGFQVWLGKEPLTKRI